MLKVAKPRKSQPPASCYSQHSRRLVLVSVPLLEECKYLQTLTLPSRAVPCHLITPTTTTHSTLHFSAGLVASQM